MMMELHEALAALGKELGIDNLQPDRWGLSEVYFDGAIRVGISGSDAAGTLTLFTLIGPLEDPDEAVLENLLAANYLGCGTDGAVLSLDAAGLLSLKRTLPARCLMYGAWIDAVTRFVNAAEFWLKHYDEGTLAFSVVAPQQQAEFPTHLMIRV